MQNDALEIYLGEKKPSGELMSFGEVQAVPPKYLWEPYLRLDNLNIVRGDGGAGKTMLVLAILAAITRGEAPQGMPGILRCDASNVIFLGNEDEPEAYRHRLDLCGCIAGRVYTKRDAPLPTLCKKFERISSSVGVCGPGINVLFPPRTSTTNTLLSCAFAILSAFHIA